MIRWFKAWRFQRRLRRAVANGNYAHISVTVDLSLPPRTIDE